MKRISTAVVFVMVLMGFTSGLASSSAVPSPASSSPVSSGVSTNRVASTAVVPWRPTPGAHFNVPRAEPDRRFRIERQIVAAINHARRGSVIQISVFSFDRKPVAEALVNAKRRGVMVRLLMNDHQMNSVMRRLHRVLGTNRTRNNFAYECTHGCRSRGENLHTKIYLFSHTGGAKNVVMTGSVNLTYNAVNNQYNDLLVRNDVPQIYAAFSALFEQMRLDKPAFPAYYKKAIGEHHELQVLPYPNFGPTNDPVIQMLNRVHCWGARGGTGRDGRTIVRVSMHAWNDWRGTYLARKVRSLFAEGCDVRVMYGMAGRGVRDELARKTRRGYVPVHINGYDTEEVNGFDGEIDLYSHQKILTVSGNYWGDSSTSFVFTGSSNWNAGGAKGDEIIFRTSSGYLVNSYLRNFNFIWTERSHLAKYIRYSNSSSTTFFRTADETVPSPGGPAWEND